MASKFTLFATDSEKSLFRSPEPLSNIMLDSQIRKSDIEGLLGKSPNQKWLFQYNGVPMKIHGFVLVTYKKNLPDAYSFIRELLSELTEAEDKKKKSSSDETGIYDNLLKKTEIIINPTENDVEDQD